MIFYVLNKETIMSMIASRDKYDYLNILTPPTISDIEEHINSSDQTLRGRMVRHIEKNCYMPDTLFPWCTEKTIFALASQVNDTQKYISDYVPEANINIIGKLLINMKHDPDYEQLKKYRPLLIDTLFQYVHHNRNHHQAAVILAENSGCEKEFLEECNLAIIRDLLKDKNPRFLMEYLQPYKDK